MRIEADHSQMKPGDMLEYRCPRFGIVWQWRVHGLYGGGERQEGLVEVSPVMGLAPATAAKSYPKTFVPEPMTRGLKLIKQNHERGPIDG